MAKAKNLCNQLNINLATTVEGWDMPCKTASGQKVFVLELGNVEIVSHVCFGIK
jgi:hypothetical protein